MATAKHHASWLALAVTLVLSILCLPSWSGPDYAKLADRASHGEKLSQSDYSDMLDYIDEGATKLLAVMKDAQKKGLDQEQLMNEVDKLDSSYPYMETFLQAVFTSTDLDESNRTRLKDLQQKLTSILQPNP